MGAAHGPEPPERGHSGQSASSPTPGLPPPRLSVLIATYQRRELLRRCLDALAAQSQPASDFEVIVVVDGSRDGTLEMLSAYRSPYRLAVEPQDHRGQVSAINRAAAIASGRYCLGLDDDIVAEPQLVAEHLRTQDELGGALVIGRLELRIPPDAGGLARWFKAGWDRHYDHLLQEPGKRTFHACYGGNLSFPRRAFLEVGGCADDLPRGFDVELAYRLERHGLPIAFAPRAAGTQELTEGFLGLASDAQRAGAGEVAFYRRHPSALPRLELARYRERPLGSFLLRGLLLRTRAPARLLALADPLIRRLPKSDHVYATIDNYFQWRGVKGALGAGEPWRRLRRGTVILMYHAVARDGERPGRYVVSRSAFARQMRCLKHLRFDVIGLDEYVRCRSEHRLPPARSIVITFDDGYRDNAELACPVLWRLRLPATVFLVSGAVGGTAEWTPDEQLRGRPLLSWSEAAQLHGRGIALGGHSVSHASLPSLSPDQAAQELRGSRAQIEAHLGRPVTHFAYPYGDCTAELERLVEQAGYLSACGVRPGLNGPATSPYALRRVEVKGGMSLARFLLALWTGFPARRR